MHLRLSGKARGIVHLGPPKSPFDHEKCIMADYTDPRTHRAAQRRLRSPIKRKDQRRTSRHSLGKG